MGGKREEGQWQQRRKKRPEVYKRERKGTMGEAGVRLRLGLCTSGPCRRGEMRGKLLLYVVASPSRVGVGTITQHLS